MARIDPTCALVLYDNRLRISSAMADDGATISSSYTEAEPRPGLPVRLGRMVAQVSGTQTAPVSLRVSAKHPGLPGRQGARVLASTDAGTSWLGHLAETHPRYWDMHPLAEGSGSAAYTSTASLCTSTGRPIVCVGGDSDTVLSYWTGSAWTSITTGDIVTTAHAEAGCALAQDPITGIVVLVTVDASDVVRTWHSDDDGESWALVSSTEPAITSTNGYRCALAATRDGLTLLVQRGGTAGHVAHLASSDLGITWTVVDTATAEGLGWSLVAVGSVLYSFSFDPSTNAIQMTRTANPYESIPDASTTAITTLTDLVAVTAWADRSGVLHCLVCDNLSGVEGSMSDVVSYDGGITWETLPWAWASLGASAGPRRMAGCHTPYGALIVSLGASPADPNQDASGHLLWLGGWTSAEWQTGVVFAPGVGVNGVLWLPFSQPGACGYTVTGAGSAALSKVGWTVAGDYQATLTSATSDAHFFDVLVLSGGSLTSLDIGMRVTWTSTELVVRLTTTGFRVYDAVGASIVDTVAADMTLRMQFLITEDRLRYKRPTDLAWTEIDMTLSTGTPGGSRSTEHVFGGFTAGVSVRWYGAGCSPTGMLEGEDNLGGHASPCYLPAAVGVPCVVTLQDGPGVPGDEVAVQPRAVYALAHLDPVEHPSPAVRWRSTQASVAEHVAWDLGAEQVIGKGLALVVSGCCVRRLRIGYYSSGSWTAAGTIDLATGFTGLSYELVGADLYPDSAGTAAAGRYIQPGELVGGYVIISGTPNICRRIIANGGGVWADGESVTPWVRLEDASGLSSTGTVMLVAPGGVMVLSPGTVQAHRYWRIRVPAQDVPDDQYEVGTAWIGSLLPMGAPPDWGWRDEYEPSVQRATDRYGTTRSQAQGPVRRTWAWGWGDGVMPGRLRLGSAIDGVGLTGGQQIVGAEDVWWSLRDALETHQALPVCGLRTVPASGSTVTDPTQWLYGYLDGGISVRNAIGTEGEEALIRVDTLTIREQV